MNSSNNTSTSIRYTGTAIALHWTIALLIAVAFVMGWVMTDMEFSPTKLKMFNWHKWVGVTVLGLVLVRSLWRFTHQPPAPVAMPAWQTVGAHAVHGLLYVLMFLQPISGWLYSNASGYPIVYLGKIPLPTLLGKNPELAHSLEEVHETLGWVLLVVIVLHALAALKHHFIDRDTTLRRMLP